MVGVNRATGNGPFAACPEERMAINNGRNWDRQAGLRPGCA
jgi:hypothetical protein